MEAFFKRSEGKPLHEEFKVVAIKGLVANQDWTKDKIEENGKEVAQFVEYIRQRAAATDRNFFIRLGRALEEREREKRKRKKPKHKNLEIEHFLFRYWDRTANNDLGLKHFTDNAVVDLLEFQFRDLAPSLGAYRKIKKSAGLVSERPVKIKQVAERDGSVYAYPRRKK